MKPALFLPGQVCGREYSIVHLHARMPVSESYVARHKLTRKVVLLTCSRFEHDPSGPPISTSFINKANKLRVLKIDGAPRVLDAGIEGDIYWIAREHVDDATLLVDFVRGAGVVIGALAEMRELLRAEPHKAREVLALIIGMSVADTLGRFAEKGIFHGGLDPRTTVALRSDGTPIVLDTGYRYLFGAGYFGNGPDGFDVRAPEQKAGSEPDARSDIYTLGSILNGLLRKASQAGVEPRSTSFTYVLRQATSQEPEGRLQSWKAFYNALLIVQKEVAALERNGDHPADEADEADGADEDEQDVSSGGSSEVPDSGMRAQRKSAASPSTVRNPGASQQVGNASVPPAPPPANDVVSHDLAVEPGKAMSETSPRSGLAPAPSVAKEIRRAWWAAFAAAFTLVAAFEGMRLLPSQERACEAAPILQVTLMLTLVPSEPQRVKDAPQPVPAKSDQANEAQVRPPLHPLPYGKGCFGWASCRSPAKKIENQGT